MFDLTHVVGKNIRRQYIELFNITNWLSMLRLQGLSLKQFHNTIKVLFPNIFQHYISQNFSV